MNKYKVHSDPIHKSNHNVFLNQMQAMPAVVTRMLCDGNPLSEKSKTQFLVLYNLKYDSLKEPHYKAKSSPLHRRNFRTNPVF